MKIVPMIIVIGCSSQRYGAHFQDYQRVNTINTAPVAAMENPIESRAVASLDNDPALLDVPHDALQANPPVEAATHPDKPGNRDLKSTKKAIKKIVLQYREKENQPTGIQSTTDMPRYKYLMWTGILALLGIVLVAFSGSGSALGVLATVAFTGALVFFILWIIKK